MCRSVSIVAAWHYKCAILREECPLSPRCDHTSSVGGLWWLTGVSANYGTDMISWSVPPTPCSSACLCLSVCLSAGVPLHHSPPWYGSWNCICIMLFVFAEITDPGSEPQLRCIKKCYAHSQGSWLNKSRVCCFNYAPVLHNNIFSMLFVCWVEPCALRL